MKNRILNLFLIFSALLMQVFTVAGVTPAYAAGTFTLTNPPAPGSVSLGGVWGSAANDVFVVGTLNDSAPIIYHNNGSGWSYVTPSAPAGLNVSLISVWGLASDNVYAVGRGYDAGYVDYPLIYHYDGSSWTYTQLALPDGWSSGILSAVWGSSASDIYATGSVFDAGYTWRSLVYHYDGTSWTIITNLASSATTFSVWSSGANDVYMSGYEYYTYPTIQHFDGTNWSYASLTIPDGLNSARLESIWGTGANDIYAAGYGTTPSYAYLPVMYHWDGSSWNSISPALPDSWASGALYKVWGLSANDIYAVGNAWGGPAADGALAYHYDGSSWTPITLTQASGSPALLGVWGSSASDVYLTGRSYNGSYTPLIYHTDAPSHTVTFDANSGTGLMDPQTASTSTAIMLNGFTRAGYIFAGWDTNPLGGGTHYDDGANYDFSADITLYAQWTTLCNVTNNADSGNGSLRWALANCPADGTITFDSSLSGGTITLTTGELLVDKNITIDGSALASQVNIDGNRSSRVFYIPSGNTVSLKHLTIANGSNGFGAGILNFSTLSILNSTLSSNSGGDGGGIYNFGALTIANSTFSDNSAGNVGGAVMNAGPGTTTISNSTFFGNSGYGAGVLNDGTLTLLNSTLAGNSNGVINNGTLSLKNTLLANKGGDCANYGTLASNVNSLIQDGSCSPMLSGDPLLDPAYLQDNGGPTGTIALQAGSPALGAGDAATCAADPINNLDQRGIARPQGSGSCDIGAFESSMNANHTVTFNANGGSGTMNPQTAYASAALTPNTFILNGYSFTGWNTAADGKGVAYGNQENYDFSADLNLYAQWRSNPPIVTSITRSQDTPTSNSKISFIVNFSENVTGVDKFDFQLSTTGSLSGFSISSVSNTGNFRTITVSAGSGSGTLCLNLIDNNTIKNLSLVPLGGPGLVNGDFTSGECYAVDREPPTVQSITRVSTSPTNSTTIAFNLTFSEGVTGVDKSDFTIVTSGTIAGTSITSVSGTGATRTVTVVVASGTGSVRLDVVDNDTIKDTLLNSLGGSGLVNGDFSTGESYNVDLAPPSVLSITRVSANPTTAVKVHFLVTFSKVVTGVDKYDFNLLTPGITGASILAVSGTGSTRIVTVATGTGSGTIQLDLIDNDTIKDAMLYKLGGTGTGNGNFLTGEIYTVR